MHGFLFPTCLLALALSVSALDLTKVPKGDWIQLFNGKDLDGWVKKVRTHPAGQDPYDTWYVKDSTLWVDYTKYTGAFNDRFGHMAYQKRKFSYYLMRAVYQFQGTQVAGAPSWAKQNNGLMYHSQSMESMSVDQSFPDCVEFQLLGEQNNQNTDGTTANVCGVGATFIINGVRGDYWCRKAAPRNIIGQPWVKVEGLVLGDSVSRHIVEGDTVLKYTSLIAKKDQKPLTEGYIAIQAESAPTKFRTIEVLDLVGCKDPKASNFRDYFVKGDPSLCKFGTSNEESDSFAGRGYRVEYSPGRFRVALPERSGYRITLADMEGRIRVSQEAIGVKEKTIPTANLGPGLYFLSISLGSETHGTKVAVLAR